MLLAGPSDPAALPNSSASIIDGDIYKVNIYSPIAADKLASLQIRPLLRLQTGYLVLAGEAGSSELENSGLDVELIAANVSMTELALDNRLDRANVGKFELIFEEDNLRLFRVDPDRISQMPEPPQLAPLRTDYMKIVYSQPRQISMQAIRGIEDLETLIALVDQDSLESYTYRLQAFYRRYVATDSNAAARDWISSKFTEFGYDSILIDTFIASSYGEAHNVVAFKTGTLKPDHHVIVGAHRDGVYNSPAADDNGSGTAAVLEMARILKDYETDLTFVFILFDAEEEGLLGSYHYADNAAANGDSIVHMFNMDMIAHYTNDTQAKIYHGPDITYCQLWQDLADSLAGITGSLMGSTTGSDHHPFISNGYDAQFLHEYDFSTVYHSPQDSTTYMNFEYMTRMVKAALATVYTISQTYAMPAVVFSYPGGLPETLIPHQAATFDVQVSAINDGTAVSGSGQLHYSINDGPYTAVSMTEISPNYYEATLPASGCDTIIKFYVSADEAENGTFYDPDPAYPKQAIVATEVITIFEDDFETNQGWTVSGSVTDGQWTRGVPVGGGDRGDPPTDFDGSGQCYLTDNVDDNSDVDGGTTTLTSPTFDLSAGNGQIHYARWFSNNFGASPYEDTMKIYISNNNGAGWTLVESVGPSGVEASGGWYEHTFWAGDFVTPTDQMKLRFDASDLGSGSVVEAAVDDVHVKVYECYDSVLMITTPSLPDWTVDHPYYQELQSLGGTGTITWSDKNGDLEGTGLTLSSDGILSGTPVASGMITFIAYIHDEGSEFNEKQFTFDINPAIIITTTSLPDWTAGAEYSQQLESAGGTSPLAWVDKNSGLTGTGLALSSSGNVTGTPSQQGEITITALVYDIAGDSAEQLYAFTINPAIEITTASIPDWTIGQPYSQQIEATGGTGQLIWSDRNLDLEGTGLELSSNGLLSGTPSTAEEINFTARATDDVAAFDDQPYSFTINPAVTITTDVLPDGEQDLPYSYQLQSSGGTEPLTWLDKNNDLDGSGLTLSSSGLLSGTPVNIGSLNFTAQVSGIAGSAAEKPLSLEIAQAYICGDASADAEVNVSDAVLIINYVFASGNPPDPMESGDTNCSGDVNVSDAVLIINYVFVGGNVPCDTTGDGEPDC